MDLSFRLATEEDATEIARLRAAVALDLTRRYGRGHWSATATEKSVLRDIRTSNVLLASSGRHVVGTLRLSPKRPWAIDPAYFSPCRRVLYLTDMAVVPGLQRRGIGRRCLTQARTLAASWRVEAIRLDAYDGPAGAGEFYVRCGFKERGRVTYQKTPLVYFELVL